MKEIINVKKDIIFKTKINEITSLNLEHDYKVNDDIVEGMLILSGTYKMTEASLVQEEFLYNIPFSIAIGENVIKDSIRIEIDDFKYNIFKDVMKVTVDLELECDESAQKDIDDFAFSDINHKDMEEEYEEEDNVDISDIDSEINDNEVEDNVTLEDILSNNDVLIGNDMSNVSINEVDNIADNETINNLTNSINVGEDNYHTYKVYIVRQGDTVESICNKYNLMPEDLNEYNDITNINAGDKIVIPQILQ